jgi:hypothetical protein
MRSKFLVVDPVAGLALVAERLRRVVLTASFFPFVDFDGLAMSSPPHRSQCSSTVSRGHIMFSSSLGDVTCGPDNELMVYLA